MHKYKLGDVLVARQNLEEPIPLRPDRFLVIGLVTHKKAAGTMYSYEVSTTSAAGMTGDDRTGEESEFALYSEWADKVIDRLKDVPGVVPLDLFLTVAPYLSPKKDKPKE